MYSLRLPWGRWALLFLGILCQMQYHAILLPLNTVEWQSKRVGGLAAAGLWCGEKNAHTNTPSATHFRLGYWNGVHSNILRQVPRINFPYGVRVPESS